MTDRVQKIISNPKDVIDDLGVTSPHRLPIIEAIEYLQEEHVSEDLEEAAEEWDESLCRSDAFKAGAKWQITKLLEEAGKHEVKVDAGGYPYIPQIELYDYLEDAPLAKEGDKYNVILIKED